MAIYCKTACSASTVTTSTTGVSINPSTPQCSALPSSSKGSVMAQPAVRWQRTLLGPYYPDQHFISPFRSWLLVCWPQWASRAGRGGSFAAATVSRGEPALAGASEMAVATNTGLCCCDSCTAVWIYQTADWPLIQLFSEAGRYGKG